MVQSTIQPKCEKNIDKLFIKLVREHFSKNSKYHKIFNRNTLKLSYCCTTNVGNIIKQHNSKVLSKTNDSINRKCNCQSTPNCPLNGECRNQCLVYKATYTTSNNSFVYYGTSEGEFKSRYNNHTKSFRHSEYMNETKLSKRVELKRPWSMVLIIIYHEKSKKGLTIPIWLK